MNRQERRRRERKAKQFDKRNTFTKKELEDANMASYEYGKRLTLQAARDTLGLGETRLRRVATRLAELEYETFNKPFEGGK